MFRQSMRWFVPTGPVKLSGIRQAGCTGAVTALQHIASGMEWSTSEIMKMKNIILRAVMKRFGDHTHFIHLRSTKRNKRGRSRGLEIGIHHSFYQLKK